MELLLVLTLIYASILVPALAVSLIAIWIYLRRIVGSLGDVRGALQVVEAETEPLEQPLKQLDGAVAGTAEAIRHARANLERADERLAVLAERRGVFALEG